MALKNDDGGINETHFVGVLAFSVATMERVDPLELRVAEDAH
jgi:hypothetical protein